MLPPRGVLPPGGCFLPGSVLPPGGASSQGVLPRGGASFRGCFLPAGLVETPPGTATAAGGTHPTRMHSCSLMGMPCLTIISGNVQENMLGVYSIINFSNSKCRKRARFVFQSI